jgi:hypothetical protein
MSIHLLTLMITTACNRRCPSCSFHMPTVTPQFWERDHFTPLAPIIGHIPNLCISGGEPLVHPRVRDLVEGIAAEFSYDKLVLATNGDLLLKHQDLFEFLDVIRIPILTEQTYPGCPDNRETLNKIRQVCPENVELVFRPTVHWTAPGQAPHDCGNAYKTTIYKDGKVYPCCMPSGEGVDATPGWRDRILGVPLPCDECVLSNITNMQREIDRKRQG